MKKSIKMLSVLLFAMLTSSISALDLNVQGVSTISIEADGIKYMGVSFKSLGLVCRGQVVLVDAKQISKGDLTVSVETYSYTLSNGKVEKRKKIVVKGDKNVNEIPIDCFIGTKTNLGFNQLILH